jgi:DNA polymerase/3'-5' exonuclease PolX
MTADAPTTEPRRFPRAEALLMAQKFVAFLENHCHRCVIAGSLRRRKELVKDIEILFVPKMVTTADPADMFGGRITVSAADAAIEVLLKIGVIAERPNKIGRFTWGSQNKLALLASSGTPIDFFSVTEACFWNALFVRTGPDKLNIKVASAARKLGWEWHAYGDGFTRGTREHKIVKSEHDVFRHVELPYLEPWEREGVA